MGVYDAARYEEACKDILDADAYMMFTLDKLSRYAARCFCQLFTDDAASRFLSLQRKYINQGNNEEFYKAESIWITKANPTPIFRFM
mmetsp:Transcript_12560/g.1880  ORF Transcript_12560/g.1880 Transcript_12560/m.1880 type:complete len:87 (+) Transcript_12560:2367-2627(+)